MLNCKPARTPVDISSKLDGSGSPVDDPNLYRSLAGDRIILMLFSRSVYICMILKSLISLLLNTFCVMFVVLLLMDYRFLALLLVSLLIILMQFGMVVLSRDVLLLVIVCL